MAAFNDITGDSLVSRAPNSNYFDGYDNIEKMTDAPVMEFLESFGDEDQAPLMEWLTKGNHEFGGFTPSFVLKTNDLSVAEVINVYNDQMR